MPSQANTVSIKKTLMWIVMTISAMSLLLSVIVSTYISIKKQKEQLVDKLETYADIIAFNATTSILFDDPETEEKRLTSFQAASMIENIHIYRIDEFTNELSFFASFNQGGVPPVPAKFSAVEKLGEATFHKNYLEMVKVIEFEKNTVGYVYLRGSLKSLDDYITNTLLIDACVGLTALSLALMITLRQQRRLTQPLTEFINIVQQVSKDKDYSIRTPDIPIKEINILGKAFNNLLERIQQQTTQQEEAEREFRQLNQNLESKVNQRTEALKEANQELLDTLEQMHQYQNQLVENEKMASLGQMVAGVAHEVNTPIGLGITASTLLTDRTVEIQEFMENKKLSASQLAKYLGDALENLSIIYRNLNRAAELISSFKQVAVDQVTEDAREIRIKHLVSEIILSLQPHLKKVKHEIVIDCEESLKINSQPGPINQILINLIMNSIIHGFEAMDYGVITIAISCSNNTCNMKYQDNGKGVPDSIKSRIFDPFVTTKRGVGGSGLGMHLVYNLVTQALGGSISLESEEGQGVIFDIHFPVSNSTVK
ncbi:HAMP domain-containing sensor histidine kinase [Algicola sagamiensis]|uniref:HAMP domain-containing sensor histidine kinase n=1 Tax=Algicola sagamiensis TaxID=163869 RepID=UPI000380BD73|nr:ATP-binding protein [Algicola sagamiensis]